MLAVAQEVLWVPVARAVALAVVLLRQVAQVAHVAALLAGFAMFLRQRAVLQEQHGHGPI